MQNKLFELLKDTDEIYSMKLKGKKNIRILFSFHIIDGCEKVVLYNCFIEKRTKNYANGIHVAEARQTEIS